MFGCLPILHGTPAEGYTNPGVSERIAHIVAFEDPGSFGDRMYGWERGRGLRDGMAHVVTADGATWIWDQVSRVFPGAVQIEEKLGYFRTNVGRMRYGEFRKKGYVIGSGAVEGACRSVINQRADLSGQRWHPEGALNVLRIRGMILDGIHDGYWERRGILAERSGPVSWRPAGRPRRAPRLRPAPRRDGRAPAGRAGRAPARGPRGRGVRRRASRR